ncbi:MAG: hypothetical protein H6P98_1921 [Candidatus Aminicenantes bacterium]|nr:hypothetical protein [Candidatus Aminicenantes bacterium]
MRKGNVPGMAAALGVTFALACITVNIYFPEATVRQTAEEIVNDIQKRATEKAGEEPVKQLSGLPQVVSFSLVPAAYAQQETNVSNPAIRALKESIAGHLAALMPSFAAGNVGLTNKGLVEIRDEAGLSLQAKAALRKLVKEDNGDRMKLYGEVANKKCQAGLVGSTGRRRLGQEELISGGRENHERYSADSSAANRTSR